NVIHNPRADTSQSDKKSGNNRSLCFHVLAKHCSHSLVIISFSLTQSHIKKHAALIVAERCSHRRNRFCIRQPFPFAIDSLPPHLPAATRCDIHLVLAGAKLREGSAILTRNSIIVANEE